MRITSSISVAVVLLLAMAGLGSAQTVASAQAATCTVLVSTANQTVRGTVVLSADAPGATRVEFSVNGARLGDGRPTEYGWLYTPDGGRTWGWDTAAVANGRYAVRCTADGTATSSPVTVTVDNPIGCRVAAPDGKQPVSGRLTFSAAHLGATPSKVEYYLHNAGTAVIPLGAATASGYGWLLAWDSTRVARGVYDVTCTATAANGTRSGSAPLTFTVDNVTPHRWPSKCLTHQPANPAEYQAMFDHRRDGWAGADGAVPIPLPDGRIIWLFGDTFAGRIDANNAMLSGWRFLNNSFQIQSGTCMTPLMGGTPQAPTTLLPSINGEVHWPTSGYADTSVSPPVVRLVASRVRNGECGWFRISGKRIYTLSLPDLRILSSVEAPYDETALNMPGFGSYLRRVGNTTYLYGGGGGFQCTAPTGAPFGLGNFAARVASNRLGLDPWQYWNGQGWTSNVNQAVPMTFDGIDRPKDPWLQDILPYGNGWLATGKLGPYAVYGPQLHVWTSASPTGPWQLHRNPDGTPVNIAPGNQGDRLYYGGRLISSVPGTSASQPMLVYSTNGLGCRDVPCTPQNDVAKNVMLYGPQFAHPINLPPQPG